MNTGSSQRGQSLIELVVGIGVGVFFLTAATGVITVSLRLDFQNKNTQEAGELTQEIIEEVGTFANADWHNLDLATRSAPLHLATSSGFFAAPQSGSSTALFGGLTYTSSFSIDDVYRDASDAIVSSGGALDPTTLKITAATQWPQNAQMNELRLVHYLMRNRNRTWIQTDWSSGSSTPPTVITFPGSGTTFTGPATFANATNTQWSSVGQLTIYSYTKNLQSSSGGNGIDSTIGNHWAWNDVVGWFDFLTSTVTVDSRLTGYANGLNVGQLALDCATSPNGNLCGSSNFNVAKDTSGTAAGNLSGYAWNDGIGWVSFCGNASGGSTWNGSTWVCPVGPTYQVTLDGSGFFHGWAWNDAVGWVSFNCNHATDGTQPPWNTSVCLSTQYVVKIGSAQVGVADLESRIWDTTRTNGAAWNTIMWQGSQPAYTNVNFQIAASNNSAGPWVYHGPDGTTATYYQPAGPNVQVRLSLSDFNNKQYVRYRVLLYSDPAQSAGPRVDDIIINWSY